MALCIATKVYRKVCDSGCDGGLPTESPKLKPSSKEQCVGRITRKDLIGPVYALPE